MSTPKSVIPYFPKINLSKIKVFLARRLSKLQLQSKQKVIERPFNTTFSSTGSKVLHKPTFSEPRQPFAKEKKKFSFSPRFFQTKKFQFIMLPFLIILLLGAYGYYWYFYSIGSIFTATIHYKFLPITTTKSINVTAQGSESGIKSVLLPAEETTTTFVNTTGEKPTGEKAKGSVSIFNPTTDVKVIKAGTILTCTSNICQSLTYTTDGDLNLGPGGSDDVHVTAGDIGENYNLAPGAGKFKVGSYDPSKDVFASNIKAISGGTPKKIVKIVKAEDIKQAEDAGMKELTTQLLNKIKTDPANVSDFIIAENTLTVEKVSAEPDLKEGQEGDIVNITVKARASVQAFKKDQIGTIVETLKKEATPDGYYLDEKYTDFSSKVSSETKDVLKVDVTLTSIARPDIDIDALKKDLGGKSYSSSDKVLSQIPHIESYSKAFEPRTLPQFFWKVPKSPSRIQIKLVAEQ